MASGQSVMLSLIFALATKQQKSRQLWRLGSCRKLAARFE